ncbi:uncharacterized protein LOC142355895 [Convolutriloba macropyga]|uniref:uncharacterized protein LOC142355895 n=1 Tax=Convolutriloba macropyga TaxID=536237 RepID=UPI003F524672
MVITRVLNVCTIGFIAAFSGVLLLAVDWQGLYSPCIVERKCDILDVAFLPNPVWSHPLWWSSSVLAYLGLLGLYLLWSLLHLVEELQDAAEMRHFYHNRLGISDRLVATMSWSEVLQRVVLLQQHIRLCIVRDLTAHDICARIMRRDNFLIGMLNKGVLALNVPLPGLRKRVMLTKLMEWNLRYCILDAMFDKNFLIKHDFKHKPAMLARRFRLMALVNLLVSPFLMAFLIIHFFMRNAEKFYHHPSSVAARSWSPYAKWRIREFNEMRHLLDHRLSASRAASTAYISQFPTPVVRQIARFTAFISGSFAALVLFLATINDVLMERHLAGHNLVWWAAWLGVLLAISRSLIGEDTPVFDPEEAMAKVVRHTHYLPRHWRGRAHTREVQEQFEGFFCFKALLFIEELASVFLTPFVLAFSLPRSAVAISEFIRDNSVHVTGIGDVCSLAQFDLERHGSRRYGGPAQVMRNRRSRQGKLEKSLVSFASTYHFWEPCHEAQRTFLEALASHNGPHFRFNGPNRPSAADSCGVGWSHMSRAMTDVRGSTLYGDPAPDAAGSLNQLASDHTALQLLYESRDDQCDMRRSQVGRRLADIESQLSSQPPSVAASTSHSTHAINSVDLDVASFSAGGASSSERSMRPTR